MADLQKPYQRIPDYLTGRLVPDVGAEAQRQAVERFLVEVKGYAPADIEVDRPLEMTIDEEVYRSGVDLVVSVDGRPWMVVKCVAGSIDSGGREIVAAARLLAAPPVSVAVVSDGRDAVVFNGGNGRVVGRGCDAIPARADAEKTGPPASLSAERIEKEKRIFRTYDIDNVNAGRRLETDR